MKRKAALLMVLLLGLTGCGMEEDSPMEAPELLEPVDVKMDIAMAQRGEIYQMSVYNGEVVPHTEELCFTMDGSLEAIHVMMGDMVQEGEVLAVLSEKQIVEQIESLEEEIEDLVRMGEFSDRQAEADLEIAREELEMLHEDGKFGYVGWVKELEIQKLELKLEEARQLRGLELQKNQDALRALQEKLGKNEIIAPYSGRIVYVSDARKGDAILGYTPVIYIADVSRLSLSTEFVSESLVKNADKVCAKIMDKDFDISYIPYENSELVKMALAGEEMKARFSIETEDATLQAGQFAVVMVYQIYRDDVLTIPINAFYRDGSGQYVYKQVDGARIRCNVKAGLTTDTKVEIVEGLEEGDMVYVKD